MSFYEPGEYEKETARKISVAKKASANRNRIREFIDGDIDENALRDDVIARNAEPVVGAIDKLGKKLDDKDFKIQNEVGVDFDPALNAKSIVDNLDAITEELELSANDPNHVVEVDDMRNSIDQVINDLKFLTNAMPKMSPTQLFALKDSPEAQFEHFELLEKQYTHLSVPELTKKIDQAIDLSTLFYQTLMKYLPRGAPSAGTEDAPPELDEDYDVNILELRRVGLEIPQDTPFVILKQELPVMLAEQQTLLKETKKELQTAKATATSSNDTKVEELIKEEDTLESRVKVLRKVNKKVQAIATPPQPPALPKTPVKTPVKTPKKENQDDDNEAQTPKRLTKTKRSKQQQDELDKAEEKRANVKKQRDNAEELKKVIVKRKSAVETDAETERKKERDERKAKAKVEHDALATKLANLQEKKKSGVRLTKKESEWLIAIPDLIAQKKVEMTGKGAKPKMTQRLTKTANAVSPKQFLELQKTGVDQSKLQLGKGSSTPPVRNSNQKRPYVITGEWFGNLKIDKTALNQNMRVIAHDGSKKVMDRGIDLSTFDLLTKNWNSKKEYSKEAWKTFADLLALSDLSIVGKQGGARVDKVRDVVAKLREKKRTGNGIKGSGIKLYKTSEELENRKKLIDGVIRTGNNNPALIEEKSEIDEVLNKARAKK